MKLAYDTVLWNGNRSRVWVDGNQVISQDLMSARNVQSILDTNAERRAMGPNRKAHGRLVASVPNVIHNEWKKEWREKYADKWEWMTFVAMKLNSRDYSYLRTTDMNVKA